MDSQPPDLPDDIATLRAELALARAQLADDKATIAHQKLEIAKLKRQIYGPRSERTARLLDQMELARTRSRPSAPPRGRRTLRRSRANVRLANPSPRT